jgi:hypothetical protein
MRRLICALIGSSLFVSLLFGGSAVYANLVVNGGFETGDFTGWTVFSTGTGRQAPAVKPTDSPYNVSHSGTYDALIPPGAVSDISQTVNGLAGAYYLDFWLEASAGDDWNVTVTLGTQTVFTHDFLSYFLYTQFVIPVTLNTGSQTLDFNFDTTYGAGPIFFDDVSMCPVPEPSTMIAAALLLLPFGLGAIRQLRKKMQAA